MDKYTKLTINELVKRKLQIEEARKKVYTQEIYCESLGGTIVVKEPSSGVLQDITEIDDVNKANKYAVYECVTEPNLKDKELQDAYECSEPMDIVSKLFTDTEINRIGAILLELTKRNRRIEPVDEVKNL